MAFCFHLYFSIAKNRLKHPIFQKFTGQGLCPWTPLGAAPPDPCRSMLAVLWTIHVTACFPYRSET